MSDDILTKGFEVKFANKLLAERFLEHLEHLSDTWDVVTLSMVLDQGQQEKLKEEYKSISRSYGYSKKQIHRLKPIKVANSYLVIFNGPSKLVRSDNGHWTTEKG